MLTEPLPISTRGRFAPYVLGTALLAVGAAAAVFSVYALIMREPVAGFLIAAGGAAVPGFALRFLGRANAEPTRREAIAAVLLTWLLVPLIGSIPLNVSAGMGFIDALFESMSGFTTTGATVITDFAAVPDTIFMWRALSQWIGGIGILVLFVAVFPQLAIAGRQMFFAEAPGPHDERLTPRLRHTAAAVLTVYTSLTVGCIAAFVIFGMTPFDAVVHTFAVVSAGGFSNHATSFAFFANPALEWIATLFMFLAGVSLPLLYRTATGRPWLPIRDAEFRGYSAILIASSGVIAVIVWQLYQVDSVRIAAFQAVSVMTTTGFASVDFATWSQPALAVLLVLMLVGGSAGSASGGIKVVRWLIIIKNTVREVRRTLRPRAVLPVRVGHSVIAEDVMRAVAAFITLYVGLFATSTLVLVMLGADFEVALTASIACIGNIGPGFGPVGPMGTYATLHPVSRAVLTFVMFAGRLEVVTVFVVFTPGWWRLPRRNPLTWWRRG
ncbi:MAG TPA: TrkH family potassium uptake protein [Trueperaceae bacterium]|nr:TrkH family potassium uptake protein [Trueperaceae bacterium]